VKDTFHILCRSLRSIPYTKVEILESHYLVTFYTEYTRAPTFENLCALPPEGRPKYF
jgi:hypothetical protein